jgi:hypothetical protein
LPSRTAEPAGAAVGVGRALGVAAGAADAVEVLLELDDELELVRSPLSHLPIAKRRTRVPTKINTTFPVLELFFVTVAVAAGGP